MAIPFWFLYTAGRILYETFKPRSRPRTTPYAEEQKPTVSNSAYGLPVPLVWGSMRLRGNVIWFSDGNPLHGPSEGDGTGIKYLTLATSVCKGPIGRLLRMWSDGEVVYDTRVYGGYSDNPTRKKNWWFTFHGGGEDEVVDTEIDDWSYPDEHPAYRGLAYVYFRRVPASQVPMLEFEVSSEAGEDASYAVLEGVEATDTDRDNIVFCPGDLSVVIVSNGVWYRVNVVTKAIEFQITHSDPQIPYVKARFDIDENGDVYAVKEDTGGYGKLCRMDGDTFTVLATSATQCLYAQRLRVSRSAGHPYVAFINGLAGTGEYIQVTHRQNLTLGGSGYVAITAPAGTEWKDISLDDYTGTLWAVANGGGKSYVAKIVLSSNGAYTQTLYDVTQAPYDWDSIMFVWKVEEYVGSWSHAKVILAASYTEGGHERVRLRFFFCDHFWKAILPPDYADGEDAVVEDARCYLRSIFQRELNNDRLYLVTYSTSDDMPTVHCIDLFPTDRIPPRLEWTFTLDESALGGASSNGGACYDRITHSVIAVCPPLGSDNDYIKIHLDKGTPTGVLLSEIVTDICAMVGVPADELDVTQLTDLVPGFLIADRCSAREALANLQEAYFFDCVESGGTLRFVKRGQSPTVTIPEDDLCAHPSGSSRPQAVVFERKQELELPQTVEVKYFDIEANYETAIQRTERLNTESVEKQAYNFPIAMYSDTAKQIATRKLAAAWTERTTYRFSLGVKYLYLDPGDVVQVTENDTTHVVRITSIKYVGSLLEVEGVSQETASYESDATGATTPIDEPEVEELGPTTLVMIDCPLWQTTRNVPGLYVAVLGLTSAWHGASVFKSEDGVNWPWKPELMTTKRATIGRATEALADVTDPWIWDEGNTVNVRLLYSGDSLTSETTDEVIAGANLALLGDEIIQFRDATLESDGTYTLSGLLRGRFGSDWATGTHSGGDYFVLLDPDLVEFLEHPTNDLDEWRWYRAASYGMYIWGGVPQYTYVNLRNMTPLSPQHVTGDRDGAGNLTVTWKRRTRISGDWADGGDVPLGETTESYEMDVMDGATVKRTISSSTESASYTAAQQTTDFGSPQSSVDVKVYQMSSVVGRGFETSATV